MGWEKRGNRSYYYTKERRGGRVVSTYIGAGLDAVLIADLEQARRDQAMLAEAPPPEPLAEIDAAIADLSQRISEAVAVELRALGFHQHKRQWRKRREQRSED